MARRRTALWVLCEVISRVVIIACVTTRMPSPEIIPAVVAADLAESIHPRGQQMSRNFWVHGAGRGIEMGSGE